MSAPARAPSVSNSDLARDHHSIVEAVREAGAVASAYFGRNPKHWDKRPGDPVSEADVAVNDCLRRALGEARPDYAWLSEESDDDPTRLDGPPVWVVDPIDGTKSFLRGSPDYAVSVALVADGRPRAAAVFNPAKDEFFDAVESGGARLNGEPIAATVRGGVDGARLLASARELRSGRWPEAFAVARVSNRGSIAYKLSLVACGRYDGAVSMTEKSDWDIAAADLIVGEAGGRTTTASGAALRYNRVSIRHPSVIAAGARLHSVLLGLLEAKPRSGDA